MMSGATAIAPNPVKKKKTSKGSTCASLPAPTKTRAKTKTPQKAETIVARCPMAKDTASPTNSALEARKLATAPVDQMTPPKPEFESGNTAGFGRLQLRRRIGN